MFEEGKKVERSKEARGAKKNKKREKEEKKPVSSDSSGFPACARPPSITQGSSRGGEPYRNGETSP